MKKRERFQIRLSAQPPSVRWQAPFMLFAILALLFAACRGGQPLGDSDGNQTEPSGEAVEVDRVVTEMVAEAPAEEGAIFESEPFAATRSLEPPNDAPYDAVYYEDYGVNPFIDSEEDNLSTFAIDVDTGSYTVMRRYLRDGYLPPDESVRVEEYVNYFEQAYERPEEGAFAIHLEGAPSPYGANERYRLVRVGLQGYEVPDESRPDAMLIFVIDVSGSMNRENRLELVKDALATLVDNLRPTDRIGIVVYGSNARVVLPPTPVDARRSILSAIESLQPEGSTNAEAGLRVAYELAEEYAQPGAINRLILCSDGVANVGNTAAESILQHAEEGIYLSTFGFGMGNYNDVLMEQLADQGDGSYAYIDTLREAERVFSNQLTSTLLTIAKDAKIQVEFNPAVIDRYRLLGYENRDVADEDFRNDDVDAGEIGAGHSVTALYEVRAAENAPLNQPAMTARVRYADPDTDEVTEIERSISLAEFHEEFEEASPRFQLSTVVAEYAEILRGSYWAQENDLQKLVPDARRVAEYLIDDEDVQEFANLVVTAAGLEE